MTFTLYACLILSIVPYGVLFIYVIRAFLIRNKTSKRSVLLKMECPPVSIILTCYNEEQYVHQKICSLLDERNWIEGSEVIVVTGGSTDATNEELLKFRDHPNVNIHILEKRISKIQGVNFAVKISKHSILVFSDFRQEMKPGSIEQLLKNFDDPTIGTVSGTIIDTKTILTPSFTRSLLNKMAINESQNSTSLNVFGALYAQRRECFSEIPEDILFDDLFVTVSTLVQNKRLIQDKDAIIYDVHFDQYYGKERIMRLARGLLLFWFNHYRLIMKIPFKNRVRFLIFKYLKLILPFSMLLALLSLIALVLNGNVVLPIIFTLLIAILFVFRFTRKGLLKLMTIHYYFAVAIVLYFKGNGRSVFWDKLQSVK